MAGRFETARQRNLPDRMVMQVPGLTADECSSLAMLALALAHKNAPKASGQSSRRMLAVYGDGFFGVHWLDDHVWFQEAGIRPFTMKTLEGKTIPIWADDPTGKIKAENPKAETRTLPGGRRQTLIFRRVARHGTRRKVRRMREGQIVTVDAPRSYPGAPGRIANRDAAAPNTAAGRVGGRIRPGNVGVRWRHPGLSPRGFIEHALRLAAYQGGVPVGPIFPVRVF